MDFLVDVLTESVIDTLKLIPFLFLTYLAMEALEHSASHHVRAAVEKSGKAGPVVGSILGALLGMKLMRKHFVKAGLAQ